MTTTPTTPTPAAGDTVTFYYWNTAEDALHACLAKVVAVHEPDEYPLALELEVAFPEGVAQAEGYIAHQSHSRRRVVDEDSRHASGKWTWPA